GLGRAGPHGLDGIDDNKPRRLAIRESGDDVLDSSFRCELDGGIVQAQALSAQADLRHRFFTGDIDRPIPGAGQCGGSLNQQGRFADAGVATYQQNRAAHKATAGYPVKFREAGREAGRITSLPGQWLEREQPAPAGLAARSSTIHAFLAEGIPFPTGFALSLPTIERSSTVLANEGQTAFRHRESPWNSGCVG